MYPEWIQEQLDKLPRPPAESRPKTTEGRIIYYLAARLNRIEAKLDHISLTLDRLLTLCEDE